MSKLKFRAWSKSEQKMYYDVRPFASTEFPGEQLAIQDLNWIDGYEFDGVLIDDVVIMQYTGLKDINGVEIYEGDIVRTMQGDSYVVGNGKFDDFDVRTYSPQVGFYLQDRDEEHETFPLYDVSYEVIGNIYETVV